MRCLARHTGQEFTVECIVKTSIFYQGDLLRAHRRVLSQDFHFDHPGTDSVVEPRLRCKGFRTACTFDPPFGGGPVYRLASGKAARETGSGNRLGKPGETGTASINGEGNREGNRDSLSFFAHEIRARAQCNACNVAVGPHGGSRSRPSLRCVILYPLFARSNDV